MSAQVNSASRAILALPPGEVKLRALLKLSNELSSDNCARSFHYGSIAYYQAKALKNKGAQAEALLVMGDCSEKQGLLKKALLFYSRSLQYSWEIQHKERAAALSLRIGRLYQKANNPAKSFYKLEQAKSLFQQTHNLYGEVEANRLVAELFMQNTDFQRAIHYLIQALNLPKKSEISQQRMQVYNRLGDAFLKMHRYKRSRNYYFKALELADSLLDSSAMAMRFADIAKTFYFDEDPVQSMKYYVSATEAFLRLEKTDAVAAMYCNRGILLDYCELTEEAKTAFIKAMQCIQAKGDQSLKARIGRRLADCYSKSRNYILAKKILEESLRLDLNLGNTEQCIDDYLQLARIGMFTSNLSLSAHYLDLADKLNQKLKSLRCFADLAQLRSDYFERIGDDRQSLSHLQDFAVAKDSLFVQLKRRGNARRVTRFSFEMQLLKDSVKIADYHYEKNDAIQKQNYEIENQKLNRISYFLGLMVIVFFAWLLAALYRDRSQRSKNEREMMALQNKDKLLNERIRIADEMHDDLGADLSNLLMKIHRTERQSPDEKKEDFGVMKSYTGTLIQNVDQIIWSLNSNRDSMADMMSFISRYFEAVADKHGIRAIIGVPIDVPKINLTPRVRRDIFLAVKEALQNAIQHAEATNLELNFEFNFPMLKISLIDNGRGYDTKAAKWGFGLNYLKKLIDRSSGKLKIHSASGTGTLVEMTFGIAPNLR